MPDSGTIDTSIYKNQNYDPFSFQNKLLDNQHKQQEVEASQLQLAMGRFQTINSAASGLLQDPDLGTTDIRKKLWDTLARATAGDAMTAQQAVEFATKFPSDPTQQRQAIKGVHAQTLDALQRGQAYLGQTQSISDPTGTHFFNVPSFGGTPRPQGFQPAGVAPGTPQYGPNNKQTFVGGAGNQPYEPQGNNLQPQQPPRLGARPPPGAPPQGARVNSQRSPDGLGYQAPGSIVASPPPGNIEAERITGAGSGEALKESRNRSLNYRQEVNPLEQAIPLLEKLGTKGSGPGTDEINHLKSFVLSNVPGANFDGLKDDVATFDKAKKYMVDWVNQNGNSGTNDKLAASFAGNPSVSISNAAASDVSKTALTLRRYKEAQLVDFEKSGKPDESYAKEAGKWAREHDPRAYGFDLMTPDQRKKVIESLPEGKDGKPGPRDLFKLQVQEAHKNGIINPKGLGK